jgi:dihydrodipicolinate synthase/N-acetylneuraminate lyase
MSAPHVFDRMTDDALPAGSAILVATAAITLGELMAEFTQLAKQGDAKGARNVLCAILRTLDRIHVYSGGKPMSTAEVVALENKYEESIHRHVQAAKRLV